MMVKTKLRRICKKCGSLFVPDGKFCRVCFNCCYINKRNFSVNRLDKKGVRWIMNRIS
jgi:uncharacterized OB-fold protein